MNVNASNDIRKFNFYQQYVWSPTDFANFQTWVLGMFRAVFEGAFGSSVLGGLEPNPAGGLNIEVRQGIAINQYGRQLILKTNTQVTVSADGSNPRRSLVVMRPVETSMTNVTDPLNPPTQVPLHVKEEFQLLVISGVAGVSPTYPAKQDGDVILFGVKIPAGASSIGITDIDYSVTERPRTAQPKIRQVAVDYTAQDDDEIIEVSCTGGDRTVTLPVAASARTKKLTVVKIDNSANDMIVSAQGAEQISGLGSISTDTQFDFFNIYSNGIDSWRRF
jgi:hypothetical protein